MARNAKNRMLHFRSILTAISLMQRYWILRVLRTSSRFSRARLKQCVRGQAQKSADSWSDIQLSDVDESSLGEWEDDWSVMEDEMTV